MAKLFMPYDKDTNTTGHYGGSQDENAPLHGNGSRLLPKTITFVASSPLKEFSLLQRGLLTCIRLRVR